jgi:hypothetical protein
MTSLSITQSLDITTKEKNGMDAHKDHHAHHRKLWPWAALLLMGLAALACTLAGSTQNTSIRQTQLAVEVRETTLALREAALNQEGGEQAQQPTPPPVAETQPPPETESPEPPSEEAPSTEEPSEEGEQAVEGSLVRASYDPAFDWGAGHDRENFDGSSGKFPKSSAGAASAFYEDGRYHITFTSSGRWTWYWSALETGNFYADIVVINGDKCVDRDSAGMVFRGDPEFDYGYMFGITCGGEYFVGITAIPGAEGIVWSIEDDHVLADQRQFISSDLIDSGPGAANRIGVWADGGEFDLYVNGKWVDAFNYWGFPISTQWSRGNIALYLGTGQRTNARVSFDDFSIWYNPEG